MNPDHKKLWKDKFNALATYNGEVSRGLIHTDEYRKKMAALQEEYDANLMAYCERDANRG